MVGSAGRGVMSTIAPAVTVCDAEPGRPSTHTAPASIQRLTDVRDEGAPSRSQRGERTNFVEPIEWVAGRGDEPVTLAFEPTKAGFDVSFGLDEDVDERAVVEILLVEVGRDATL